MLLKERFQLNRPLEEMECALVRAAHERPALVNPREEAVLRTALSLARLYKVRHDGRDVGVGTSVAPFREDVTRRLGPLLLARQPPRRDQLVPQVAALAESTPAIRKRVQDRFKDRLPPEAIDREIRHKAFVLVSGGGGGTGYVYLGVMALLDEFGIRPSLLAGTSIGAILSLFRSRMGRFEQTEMINIVRGLSWRRLFRAISTENRYGLPAALRLFLRAGIGRYFNAPDPNQPAMRLKDLPTPTLISVTGIRRGMLPHPIEFYERLVRFGPRSLLNPSLVARQLASAMSAIAELVMRPEMLVRVHLGLDDATAEFDALDAAGFSSALPGVIHYDVLRDDPQMHELLGGLLEDKGIFRLIDGGIADNLPCKAAWRAVHKGQIGTRNAFILGLNGFAPKLLTPLWLPLERLAELNVGPNRPYAHLIKDFKRTLSPLELVPSVPLVSKAIELGRAQLVGDMPFISRMLTPLPPLAGL